ncbi:MAG: endonuclease Q family protein [Candidatus Hodarchaeales archaeon]
MITTRIIRFEKSMKIAMDLHAHSVFAGGTQALKLSPEYMKENKKKALRQLSMTNETMPLKGIELIGTGDCQFIPWTNILKEALSEEDNGIFILKNHHETKFLLQTEVIFTSPIGKRSKIVHVVLLFPDFNSVETFQEQLKKWEVKYEKMARPFIKTKSPNMVADRLNEILDIDSWVEAIPAHIMTPQGVFGSNIRINSLEDFFGNASTRIQVVETGLSADPAFLALIPELDERTLISSSDAHSSALHRMGREFTIINVEKLTYRDIILGLRRNKIDLTAEFPPEEGRFFLTGHRAGRKTPGTHGKDEYCYFSPKHVPVNDICPICGKTLTIGVFQRCCEISRAQGAERVLHEVKPNSKFITMVPLIDILGDVLKIKTKTSKTLISNYKQIIAEIGPESTLWQVNKEKIQEQLEGKIKSNILEAILKIKERDFTFHPYGYDGTYGELKIGETGDFTNVKVIKSAKPIQTQL